MSMITDDVLRLSDINDFLEVLTIFKSKSFELIKRCLDRETLNFFNFDNITFVDNEELNSKSRSKILESK